MKIFLKGNYNNNLIHLEYFKLKNPTKKVFLNIHGLYGESGEAHSKSKKLGNLLLKNNFCNVVYYSSSRDWSVFQSDNQELSKQSFIDKTFQEEQQDLLDAVDLLNAVSKDLFNVPKPLEFYIVANSLGGTILSSLIEQIAGVKKIVLCGSGTGASSTKKPILSTYPSKKAITIPPMTYRGELILLQGSEDQVVPLFSQDELYSAYSVVESKQKIIIPGANHNFSNINGKNKLLAQKKYVDTIIDFFQKTD